MPFAIDTTPTTTTAHEDGPRSGKVDKIKFVNSENGFCVLFVSVNGKRETWVGTMPHAFEGATLKAEGKWEPSKYGGDQFRVTNSSTARTWNAERGSFECEVALATVSGGFQVVCGVYHDANNNAAVAWDGANSRWIFNVRAGGTLATAYKAASPSSGVFYQLGVRWLSSSGEYGGTSRAISVWVDRVKGTDAAAAATMTEVSTPTYGLEIGAYTGSLPLDGQIRKIASYAYPKSDVEMSRTL